MATIPQDGRITSLGPLTGKLLGSEVSYIVSPGTASAGISYYITQNTLAAFYAAFPTLNSSLITSGATYNALTTDTAILVDKTIGSATSVVMPLASAMLYGQRVLIKDAKGDASTNPITITFTGGQLCDGEATIIINNAYGWIYITPLPTGTSWYMS